MLSYRHSFHAGNFADVIKHIVLVNILVHLRQKETPFEYIDTHAGAGLYHLHAPEAQKLQEFEGGIAKLSVEDFAELSDYFEAIAAFNPSATLDFYPGSPSIAAHFLRRQDRGWLFELHPRDYALLTENTAKRKNIRVQHQDGFAGLKALLPPTSRRGLVLIDPSYEIKSDYQLVVERVIEAYKKFSHGIYAIWYPVVDRATIDQLQKKLVNSGIKNVQCFELGMRADSAERGMTASGMIVINPPWKLFDHMAQVLPKLVDKLGTTDDAFYRCDVLVAE